MQDIYEICPVIYDLKHEWFTIYDILRPQVLMFWPLYLDIVFSDLLNSYNLLTSFIFVSLIVAWDELCPFQSGSPFISLPMACTPVYRVSAGISRTAVLARSWAISSPFYWRCLSGAARPQHWLTLHNSLWWPREVWAGQLSAMHSLTAALFGRVRNGTPVSSLNIPIAPKKTFVSPPNLEEPFMHRDFTHV